MVEAVGPGVTSVKEGDAVILSTLAHCGRCPACEVGKPTACRNAPSPKDARPFTVGGKPAYQFANASVFAELHAGARAERDSRSTRACPSTALALIGCGIMTGVGAVLNRARVETGVVDGRLRRRWHRPQLRAGRRAGRRGEDHRRRRACRRSSSWARRFGATHVIDASKDDPVAAVKDLTGGGADYTFECVGNLAVIKPGARRARRRRRRSPSSACRSIGSSVELRRPRALPEQGDPRLPLRYGASAARLPDARRPLPRRAGCKIDELITDRYALDDFDRALRRPATTATWRAASSRSAARSETGKETCNGTLRDIT